MESPGAPPLSSCLSSAIGIPKAQRVCICYDEFFKGICQQVRSISPIFPVIYKASVEKKRTK
jgi:hypothetical protein